MPLPVLPCLLYGHNSAFPKNGVGKRVVGPATRCQAIFGVNIRGRRYGKLRPAWGRASAVTSCQIVFAVLVVISFFAKRR